MPDGEAASPGRLPERSLTAPAEPPTGSPSLTLGRDGLLSAVSAHAGR